MYFQAFLLLGLLLTPTISVYTQCLGNINGIQLYNTNPMFLFDANQDGENDFIFSFYAGGINDYEFAIEPISDAESNRLIKICSSAPVRTACAYIEHETVTLEQDQFDNTNIILNAWIDIFGSPSPIGDFPLVAPRYIVYQIGDELGWMEIFINTLDPQNSELNFSIREHRNYALGTTEMEMGDCNAILPIVLHHFSSEITKEGVQLNWSIASAIDVEFIELQHSVDGFHFETIKTLDPQISTLYGPHAFLHQRPHPGPNYYRLATHDLDGTTDYSSIIIDNWGGAGLQIVGSNVVQTELILLNQDPELQSIRIINSIGHCVYEVPSAFDQISIDVRHWSEGIYFIVSKNNYPTLKWLKRN